MSPYDTRPRSQKQQSLQKRIEKKAKKYYNKLCYEYDWKASKTPALGVDVSAFPGYLLKDFTMTQIRKRGQNGIHFYEGSWGGLLTYLRNNCGRNERGKLKLETFIRHRLFGAEEDGDQKKRKTPTANDDASTQRQVKPKQPPPPPALSELGRTETSSGNKDREDKRELPAPTASQRENRNDPTHFSLLQLEQGESPAPQQSPESLNVSEQQALSYMDLVRTTFNDQPAIVHEFHATLQDFKQERVDRAEVIRRVQTLFHGHDDLIVGFTSFLPFGHNLGLADEDEAKMQSEHQQQQRSMQQAFVAEAGGGTASSREPRQSFAARAVVVPSEAEHAASGTTKDGRTAESPLEIDEEEEPRPLPDNDETLTRIVEILARLSDQQKKSVRQFLDLLGDKPPRPVAGWNVGSDFVQAAKTLPMLDTETRNILKTYLPSKPAPKQEAL